MSALLRRASSFKHFLLRTDARLCESYLLSGTSAKLHIGSGQRVITGWLNSDLHRSKGVVAMDATQAFPFADTTFDYIYSEHMIEHIAYPAGARMLMECRRTLKPGGVVRIVTPDMASLLELAGTELTDLHQRYLEFFYRTFLPNDVPKNAVSVLNAHFREWGHTYIYDEKSLRGAMADAGFVEIQRYALNDSSHDALAGLGNDSRYPPMLLDFESVVLEGTSPMV